MLACYCHNQPLKLSQYNAQQRNNHHTPQKTKTNRGKVPIGWAIDPELSLRFPVIFQYLYKSATQNDVFISGDSGAGYINPTQLIPPRAVSKIATSGGPEWVAWNKEWYVNQFIVPLATENLLENTDGVLRTTHRCSLGVAACCFY